MVEPAITPTLLIYSLVGQSVGEGLLVAGLLASLPRLSKFSLRELGFRMPKWSTLGIALVGAIAMIVVSNGLASLIDSLLHSTHQQDVVAIFKNTHDHTAIIVLSIYAVVFAPFFEETIFRVFFFNLGLRFGGFWIAAIVSGLLFGIAHGDLVYTAIPLALGGMILCGVYYRSENAWASMISHSCFNAVSILAIVFFPKLV
jgi:membrane protease YdiL (CAAX protease family)